MIDATSLPGISAHRPLRTAYRPDVQSSGNLIRRRRRPTHGDTDHSWLYAESGHLFTARLSNICCRMWVDRFRIFSQPVL